MKTRRIVRLGLFTCLALVLSYIETLIPNPFPVPGAKLGLTNIVTLLMLQDYKPEDILMVILARVLLAGFLFGSFSSIIYSLTGALVSFSLMIILYRYKFNLILISITGGISHNLGQLLVATLVTQTFSLFYSYGFYLMIIGFLTGLFNGLILVFLRKYLPRLEDGLQ